MVARSVKESPSDTSIFLLASHGMLAISRTFSDAFDFAELAEDTAKIAYLRETQRGAQAPSDQRISGSGSDGAAE